MYTIITAENLHAPSTPYVTLDLNAVLSCITCISSCFTFGAFLTWSTCIYLRKYWPLVLTKIDFFCYLLFQYVWFSKEAGVSIKGRELRDTSTIEGPPSKRTRTVNPYGKKSLSKVANYGNLCLETPRIMCTQKTIQVGFEWKKSPSSCFMCKIHPVLMTYQSTSQYNWHIFFPVHYDVGWAELYYAV